MGATLDQVKSKLISDYSELNRDSVIDNAQLPDIEIVRSGVLSLRGRLRSNFLMINSGTPETSEQAKYFHDQLSEVDRDTTRLGLALFALREQPIFNDLIDTFTLNYFLMQSYGHDISNFFDHQGIVKQGFEDHVMQMSDRLVMLIDGAYPLEVDAGFVGSMLMDRVPYLGEQYAKRAVDIQAEGDHKFAAHHNSVYATLFELATNSFNPYKGNADKMLVKFSEGEGSTVIEAMDNGQGIDVGSEEAIFDYGHTRVGRGLGLCLARATMIAMGGSIEAKCKSDNPEYGGASFRMELPSLDPDKLVGLPYDF
jgi:hypothetical protein